MRERYAGVGTRGARIEPYRHIEEVLRQFVLGPREPVHIPKPAMIGFPSTKRARGFQNRSVPLDGLDFAGDRGHDLVAAVANRLRPRRYRAHYLASTR